MGSGRGAEGRGGEPLVLTFHLMPTIFVGIGFRIPKAAGSIPLHRLAERAEDFPKYRFA